ncbi:hypothetical protein TSAR_004030 [Trichomalopsis sarcophagae]|uniref:Uncharacterized protein n=1 Tax=Trichomalopsis sarcophagae TaxID=543379 RepID=A0A232EXJ8_9HYME|nr:hypothetical protein TSAR_004030 [Trichomalopsis sarcophagae]
MLSIKQLSVLSLILGAQGLALAAYDFIDATSDMLFFFPAPPLVFINAIQIWQQFKKVSHLWNSGSPSGGKKIDKILSGMEKLSMDVYKIQESIQHQLMTLLPKEIDLDNKLNDIYEQSGKIDYLFHLSTRIRPYESSTTSWSIPSESLRCKREQSSLQLINNLYNNIILAEVKGIIMIHYAHNLHRQINERIYLKLSPIFTQLTINSSRFGDGKFHDKERYGLISYWCSWGGREDRKRGYRLRRLSVGKNPTVRKKSSILNYSIGTKKIYGFEGSECPTKVEQLRESSFAAQFRALELCFCTCEEDSPASDDRYFSLKPVTSNVVKNKCENRAQEQNGPVSSSAGSASRERQYSAKKRQLEATSTLHNRQGLAQNNLRRSDSQYIDSLEAPANCALTGLKFEKEGSSLKLAMQYTQRQAHREWIDLDLQSSLVYNGGRKSSSFITMKLQTYNYAKHLRVEPKNSNALDKFLEDYDKGVYDLLFEASESNEAIGTLLLD